MIKSKGRPAAKRCMLKPCDGTAILRGLCHRHYHQMYRSIKVGAVASWAAAARSGLAVAQKQKPGPKRT